MEDLIIGILIVIMFLVLIFYREKFSIGSGRLQLVRKDSSGSSKIDFRSTGQYESRACDGCATYGEANAAAIGAFLKLSHANYAGIMPVSGPVQYTIWVRDKYIPLGTLAGLSRDIVDGVRLAESLIKCHCNKPPLLGGCIEPIFGARETNMDTDEETQLGFASIYNV